MRQRRRLRRPVREMRQHPQPRGADQPQEQAQRRRAGQKEDHALVPPAAGLRALAAQMDPRRAPGVALQRLRPGQELAGRRPAAARRHARPRLGRARARGGRRGQGPLCLVRRADRLHLQHEGAPARQLGEVVEVARHPAHPLHRQGQHRLPLHRLPLDAEGLRRRLHPAGQRPRQRVPQPRGRQDLDLARLGRLGPRIPAGFPRQAGRPPLRAYRQRPRDQGQRLQLEGLPAAQQQRARGHLR